MEEEPKQEAYHHILFAYSEPGNHDAIESLTEDSKEAGITLLVNEIYNTGEAYGMAKGIAFNSVFIAHDIGMMDSLKVAKAFREQDPDVPIFVSYDGDSTQTLTVQGLQIEKAEAYDNSRVITRSSPVYAALLQQIVVGEIVDYQFAAEPTRTIRIPKKVVDEAERLMKIAREGSNEEFAQEGLRVEDPDLYFFDQSTHVFEALTDYRRKHGTASKEKLSLLQDIITLDLAYILACNRRQFLEEQLVGDILVEHPKMGQVWIEEFTDLPTS